MRLAKFAGSFALFIAGMALLTFISLFVVGAYLASWPIMRVSPRARRLTSVMGLATAAMTVARAYGLDAAMTRTPPEPEATEDTEATEDGTMLPYPYPYDMDDGRIAVAPGCAYDPQTQTISWDGRRFVHADITGAEGGDN